MKRIILACIIVAVLLSIGSCSGGSCGGGKTGDTAAIEDTIRGYVTTYNAEDFDKCLTYFTGYEDREDALGFLSFWRGLSGELELKKIEDITIVPVAMPGGSRTATASVTFTFAGEDGTAQMELKEVDGQWKIVWEQGQADVQPPGDVGSQTQGKLTFTELYFDSMEVLDQPNYRYDVTYTAYVTNTSTDRVKVVSIVYSFYNQAGELVHEIPLHYEDNWVEPGATAGMGSNVQLTEKLGWYDMTVIDGDGTEYVFHNKK